MPFFLSFFFDKIQIPILICIPYICCVTGLAFVLSSFCIFIDSKSFNLSEINHTVESFCSLAREDYLLAVLFFSFFFK